MISANETFLDEMQKLGTMGNMAKMVAGVGAGAAAGAGGAYLLGEKKRKTHLRQLSDLFRQANIAENSLIRRKSFIAGAQSKGK